MQSHNMSSRIMKKLNSPTYYFIIPLIIVLHVGWYKLQQRQVPEVERHDHPLIELYKRYIK